MIAHTHTHTHTLSLSLSCITVARRCIPTFVNVQEQFDDVFNFNTSEDIQNVATTDSIGDLFLNLSVSDIVDGTL